MAVGSEGGGACSGGRLLAAQSVRTTGKAQAASTLTWLVGQPLTQSPTSSFHCCRCWRGSAAAAAAAAPEGAERRGGGRRAARWSASGGGAPALPAAAACWAAWLLLPLRAARLSWRGRRDLGTATSRPEPGGSVKGAWECSRGDRKVCWRLTEPQHTRTGNHVSGEPRHAACTAPSTLFCVQTPCAATIAAQRNAR